MSMDWKVVGSSEKRKQYDKKMKSKGTVKSRIVPTKGLPIRSNDYLRENMNKVSNDDQVLIPHKLKILKKDERLNLEQLSYDKSYLQRLLLDEEIRLLYLRGHPLNEKVLSEKPHLRLFSEAKLNRISSHSRTLRKVIKHEVNFLSNRYQEHRKLHFWETLQTLDIGKDYRKRTKFAIKKERNYKKLIDDLEYMWTLYNNRLYRAVEKATISFINKINKWHDKDTMSNKFKILCDLYYIRGLALMHLKKYDESQQCFQKDRKIGETSNFQISIDRSNDNIGRIEAIRGHYDEAIKIWSHRLENVTNLNEKPWFYYGIAQCYAMNGDLENAIDVIFQCIVSATKAESQCWEFNGNILLANYFAKLGSTLKVNVPENTVQSLKAIGRAYSCAAALSNSFALSMILKVVWYIYNSFKDIDLTLLSNVWSKQLMEKAYQMYRTKNDHEQSFEDEHNFSEVFNNQNSYEQTIPQFSKQFSIYKKTPSNNTNSRINTVQYKMISNFIVDVNLGDLVSNISSPEIDNRTPPIDSSCYSPISAVEVVLSETLKKDDIDDGWLTESDSVAS